MILSETREWKRPLEQLFFVGDLQGRYSLLMDALDKAGFDKSRGDMLICAGDLVDGGKENELCLSLLQETWFKSVMGNHDVMFLSIPPKITEDQFNALSHWIVEEQGLLKTMKWYHKNGKAKDLQTLHPDLTLDVANWILNGGSWFFDGYVQMGFKARMEMHKTFMEHQGPLSMTIKAAGHTFGVVHAAIIRGNWSYTIESLSNPAVKEHILWDRDNFKDALKGMDEGLDDASHMIKDLTALVVGHNIVPSGQPIVCGNTCFMDVGAKIGRPLVVWSAQNVIDQIAARREFVKKFLGD